MGDVCVQTSASTICLILPRQRKGSTSFCGVNHTGTEAALWLMTPIKPCKELNWDPGKFGSFVLWWWKWNRSDLKQTRFEDLPEPKPKTTAVTTTTTSGLTFRAGVTCSMRHYTFLIIFSFPEKKLGKKSMDYINLPRTTRCLELKPTVRTWRCIKIYFKVVRDFYFYYCPKICQICNGWIKIKGPAQSEQTVKLAVVSDSLQL